MIDLGAADGRMLDSLQQKYTKARCVGVEYSRDLVDFAKAKYPHLEIVRGDAQSLNFPDTSFDVVIAAALIEHVPDPAKIICEAKRILRPGGILILTSPDPFWGHLAALVGHIKKGQHKTLMNLKQLSDLAMKSGFNILKTQKFMLSPVGVPFEFILEKGIRNLHLDFLMANQLLVAGCRA
jgi:ubiquinone/menaquinone biosynthesis C-methylase UbiE